MEDLTTLYHLAEAAMVTVDTVVVDMAVVVMAVEVLEDHTTTTHSVVVTPAAVAAAVLVEFHLGHLDTATIPARRYSP